MRIRRSFAEIARAAALVERSAIVAELNRRAERIESGRYSDDRALFARRLRALAGDIDQGLHDGETARG